MAFSPQFLDELRGRLSLAAVVGRRVKLTRRGREHSGLCPFHNEKSPSFTVNEDKGFFHCFGCGAHGDVIGFEMRAGNLSFPESVERLAAEAGLEVPRQAPEERARAEREATLYEPMEAACAHFEKQLRLPQGRAALDYLRGRGLDDATIARFRLGYAPDSREGLKTALVKDHGESALIETGLLILPEGGGASYDRFRGRVMFPIADRRGRVIAFGGRIMGEGQPKYLNSPDTPLFHKGRVLYNLPFAREAARDAGTVIVCEGYMDVIGLARGGFGHAVAPLGTALTESQIEELWRLAPEPILCFDGDAAGQRAAARAAERALPLLKPGYSLRFALIPAPEDPDSLIKTQGPTAMTQVLERADTLFEVMWRMETAGRLIDTPERRAAIEKSLHERAALIADRAVQQQYERMFRDRLWDTFSASRRREPFPAKGTFRGKTMGKLPRPSLPEGGGARAAVSAAQMHQRILLAVVVNHPGLLDEVGERLGSVDFPDKDLDNLRQEILKHLHGGSGLDSAAFQRHLRACGFSQALDSLLGSNVYVHASFSRPGAAVEAARSGWEHTFGLYLRKDLTGDVSKAEQELARDASAESFSRFLALKMQQQEIGNGDGETASAPAPGNVVPQ